MIFVRGLINPSGLWGRLVFEYRASYRLFFSPFLTSEILEVVARPEVRRKFRRLTPEIPTALARILEEAERVETPEIPRVSRDAKDDKVLAAAKEAGAAYLITEDNDLLVLGEYEGTRIITAGAFMRALEQ